MRGDDRPRAVADRPGGSGSPGTEQVSGSAAPAAPTAPVSRPIREDDEMKQDVTRPLERPEPGPEVAGPEPSAPGGPGDDRNSPDADADAERSSPHADAGADRDVPATLRAPSGPYLPAVVLGLVLAGIAAVIALDEWGVEVDLGVVVPVAMVVLGLLLVLGALLTVARERRR